jgi:hypothetical protein
MIRTIAQFGYGVWMLIAMCLVSVVYAALFAARGGARRFRVLCALAIGLTCATAAALCMGMAAAASGVARMLSRGEPVPLPQLVAGLGEVFATGLMGFASLTLVALLAAAAFVRGVAGSGAGTGG